LKHKIYETGVIHIKVGPASLEMKMERTGDGGIVYPKGSALGAALKAAYLAGESPAPGIAYLPG